MACTRIQVQLTDAQERQLRDMSRLRQTSISALIREGIDRLIVPEETDWASRTARAAEIIGKYRSGRSDIGADHDRYFAEAILEPKNDA